MLLRPPPANPLAPFPSDDPTFSNDTRKYNKVHLRHFRDLLSCLHSKLAPKYNNSQLTGSGFQKCPSYGNNNTVSQSRRVLDYKRADEIAKNTADASVVKLRCATTQ